jgi:hypothetical protein
MPPAAQLGWWEPDGTTRLVVATADPATLPDKATWYLAMNLPRPGSPREAASAHPSADLAEVTRIYGIRHWNGQSYKQVKDQLGWADFQACSTPRSAGLRPWSTARSAFCWTPGSTIIPHRRKRRNCGRHPAVERGPARRLTAAGTVLAARPARYALGFSPWFALQRWWQAWSDRPPPPQLQALMNSVAGGCGLHLYLPN